MTLQLSQRPNLRLRFAVGERVECLTREWSAGTVVRLFYTQSSFDQGTCVPYQVRLDSGKLIFVPQDVDRVCRAEAPITNRASAIARLRSPLPKPGNAPPVLADGIKRAADELSRLHSFFVQTLEGEPEPVRALPWDGFRLEVQLLLVGCKPSVLIMSPCVPAAAHLQPTFSQRLVTHVFQPWLTNMPETPLRLRRIERDCQAHNSAAGSVTGEWVLYSTKHPQCVEVRPEQAHTSLAAQTSPAPNAPPQVEAAFFGPPTLTWPGGPPNGCDVLLWLMMARALGYPSDAQRPDLNCEVAFTRPGFEHLQSVEDDDMLFDYMCEGPRELSRVVAHYLECRDQTLKHGLPDFHFAMGGRVIATAHLQRIVDGARDAQDVVDGVDALVGQINHLNIQDEEED